MISVLHLLRVLRRLSIPAFLILNLVSTGCSGFHGFHLHQPEDLENAKSAQTHFQKAALSKTVEAERERLSSVLKEELDLVARHTLARRDARLLFIIGEGDTESSWEFLNEDIKNRITADFGLTMDTFQETVTQLSQRPDSLADVLASLDRWKARLAKNPALPALSCSVRKGAPPDPPDSLPALDKPHYENFKKDCEDYLKIATPKLGNEQTIADVRDAQHKVANLIKTHQREYETARDEYAKALKSGEESEITAKASEFRDKIKKIADLPKELGDMKELKAAKTALGTLGLGDIIEDLKSEATIARLEVEREKVLAMLSAIIHADSSIKPDAEVPETAADIIGVLATVGKALEKAENYPPVSKLQIQAEQLRLNLVAAQRRKAFFDKTLSLLEKQREARIQEILYLARVEQLRRQIAGDDGCLKEQAKAQELPRIFETQSGVDEKCREKVFKLLAAYSNSWLLGRVPQEQLDYQIINLHHVAALDTSEIAFARWESLLGVPIHQLVTLHGTGVRREDISTIINALGYIGITAAVGAN